jgi:alginate O-acetyltransferase complex protein AlgJ
MPSIPHPAPRRGGPTDPSHDEELRRGILRTDVSPPVAALLVGAFLLVIAAVPIFQVVRDKVAGDDSVLLDLFRHAPTKDSIKQFEEDLDKASTPREWVRPRMQALFVRFGGFGNTKAVVGRDGWLFYAPGLTAVGGPGFLDRAIIDSRRKAALDAGDAEIFPDPRPAVVDFARYLRSRGIALVLFPVPDKATLQPRELHGRASGSSGPPPRNPDADRFAAEMRAAGVTVFDPTPARLQPGEPPRFMRQDTHWTPEWMQAVAGALATTLVGEGRLGPPARPRAWRVSETRVSRVGDVTDMLGLPEGQTLYAPDTVTIREVRDQAGVLFAPAEAAEVLLLGDSFTNVFALDQMGWGEGAGFGAHLALALGRDVDVLAQNDAGAFATRRLLANALGGTEGGGPDRLTGKKVVVWELASRELAVGNWKPITWPPVAAAGAAPQPGQGHRPAPDGSGAP